VIFAFSLLDTILTVVIVVFGSSGYLGGLLSRELDALRIKNICPNRQDVQLGDLISLKSWRSNTLNEKLQSELTIFFLASKKKASNWSQEQIDEPASYIKNISKVFGNSQVIFTSSVDVYGHPHVLPITESAPTNCLNSYANSKLKSELAFQDYFPSDKVLTLRLPGVYGYSSKSDSVYDYFYRQLVSGLPLNLVNSNVLKLKRDWICAQDLVAFMIRLSEQFTPGLFNFVSGRSRLISEYINILSESLHSKPTYIFGSVKEDDQGFDLVFDAKNLYESFPHVRFSQPSIEHFIA